MKFKVAPSYIASSRLAIYMRKSPRKKERGGDKGEEGRKGGKREREEDEGRRGER